MVCEQYFYKRAVDKEYNEIKAISGENYRIADACANAWLTSVPAVFALGAFVGFFSAVTQNTDMIYYTLGTGAFSIATSGVLYLIPTNQKLHKNKKQIASILKKRPDLIDRVNEEMLY